MSDKQDSQFPDDLYVASVSYLPVVVEVDTPPVACPGCGNKVRVRLSLQVRCEGEHAVSEEPHKP